MKLSELIVYGSIPTGIGILAGLINQSFVIGFQAFFFSWIPMGIIHWRLNWCEEGKSCPY